MLKKDIVLIYLGIRNNQVYHSLNQFRHKSSPKVQFNKMKVSFLLINCTEH